MDEVANAGAIRRIVVVAEDLDFFALSGCRFTSDLDKVRRLRRRLSRASQRICPRHIEVAQGDIAQVMGAGGRSEEHTSELQSLMRISYAVFCLKKQTTIRHTHKTNYTDFEL